MASRRTRRYSGKAPTSIRLTERDGRLLEYIHAYDGVMSLRQIDELFFRGRGGSWPRERLRALAAHDLVRSPKPAERHLVPAGEQIYWLGKRGAEQVAGLQGQQVQAFPWRRTPRWSILQHDLAVNDFRIDVQRAVSTDPRLTLQYWVPEGEFLVHPDTVTYHGFLGKRRKRQVRPDGFFVVRRMDGRAASDFAFLLEVDMATEDNPRFVRDKVLPGLAYLKSDAYRQRFGLRYGRWLVVTTTEQRLRNMVEHAGRAGASGLFYFTTFAQVDPNTLLHAPIWTAAGRVESVALIPAS